MAGAARIGSDDNLTW